VALTSNYTESTRSFSDGFFLNEQEFRRLIDTINEQFDKNGAPNPQIKYTVTHRNGLVAESFDQSDVLRIENAGSHQIISLSIAATSTVDQNDNVTVSFSNKYAESRFEDSIKYKVIGVNRDWVMVMSSLIDERLGRIKSSSLIKRFSTRAVVMSILLGVTAFAIYGTYRTADQSSTAKVISAIEARHSNHERLDVRF